jgi:hypothetical protein
MKSLEMDSQSTVRVDLCEVNFRNPPPKADIGGAPQV